MHRIIEAFTRPHYAVTAVDEVIMSVTVIGIALMALTIWFVLTEIIAEHRRKSFDKRS